MSTYSVGKDIQALVADIGSFSTKIGYAGDDHPQAVYNSTTAVVRNSNSNNNNNAQGSTSSCFLKRPKRDFNTRPVEGEKVGDGSYELVNPVDEATGWLFSAPSRSRFGGGSSLTSNEADNTNVGVGGNDDNDGNDRLGDAWESHELVSQYLHHSFQNALGLDVPADNSLDYAHNHPLLLLDKPHTPPALRQRILEILFETHDLPAVFVLRDAIASCYAVGRTTATVVDVGYSAAVVTPVYEGFVETRGVRRNVACGARATEERVLRAMDGIVKKQGGRRRKDRMRRRDQRRLEKEQGASAGANSNNVGEQRGEQQQQQEEAQAKRPSAKRDKHGHFIKESTALSQSLAPIPDYLMPLYQVRRAPKYTTRTTPFHEWSRLTLARDIKEMGLGAAVGPTGYVSSAAAAAAKHAAREGEGENSAADALNPATANNLFLQSSKLPYTLPDGTPVEITTASRCDVVEVFFGNDEENVQYREQKLDEAMNKLDEYEADIENYLNQEQKMEEDDNAKQDAMVGITSSESAAGDPYSKTSYKGEKLARGRSSKQMHYSPGTISNKLYAACLPYVRTAPAANLNNNESGLDGGDKDTSGGVNDNYYHYLTSAPPAQMVCDAAFRCDRDQQAALLGNVVVCGGGACITGAANVGGSMGAGTSPNLASALGDEHAFPDRLREEIEGIVHRHTPGWRVKVTSPNISERAICGWLGGSILGSLGTFRDMWISKRDYEEFGSAIVNRKCP